MHFPTSPQPLATPALTQAEEAQQRQQQQSQLTPKQREVLGIVQQNELKARSVEDPALMARARALMPLADWRAAAQAEQDLNRQLSPGTPPAAVDDLVVKSMLRWFKQDFFSWVNNAPCSTCGNSSTSSAGMAEPTAAERPHAGRVELYNCDVCGQVTRFPRYNDPAKLLDSRRGRCGEWAHCFLLMLRAAGYDARHVCDNADHVWCEYYSRAMGRWVHVDACEAAYDTPLLYEGGWGKALGFVLAASWHSHADVTRRYVLPAALAQLSTRRGGVPDQWVMQVLTQATTRLRSSLSLQQRRALAARDVAEMLQLLTLDGAAGAEAAAADLPGRQSGAEAWRQARGETGPSSSSSSRPAAASPPTAFTPAADTALPPLFGAAGRLTGGACRASGEHTSCSPSQVALRLFDGSLATKWLDFGGGGQQGAAWAEYRLLPNRDPDVISHYDVISAEDCPERDPCDWVLEAAAGSNDSSSSSGVHDNTHTWVVLHEVQGHSFRRRHQLCSFAVPAAGRVASRAWRLRITRTADPAAATCVQLACWNLYCCSGHQQGPNELLYLDAEACAKLQALAAAGDIEEGAAAVQQALLTLRRILANMTQHPDDAKYAKLSTSAARVQQLLDVPLLQAALFAAGFRPVLLPPSSAGAGDGLQLALVAADGGRGGGAAAVAEAVQKLIALEGGGGVEESK